jgi:hypothetical protein
MSPEKSLFLVSFAIPSLEIHLFLRQYLSLFGQEKLSKIPFFSMLLS